MPGTIIVLKVENPHFTIRLYENLLKIDLKGSFKNEIEEALENKPVLKETIGKILGIFVPLHIRLNEINSVNMDETGKIKVSLPHHRDIVIPFERKEDAEKLVEKLNQLISRVETEKIQEIKSRRRVETEKIQRSKVRSRAERKRIRKRSRADRRV
jgi:LPS O-antigen subunit length determinant protein (WzzB/FepE family)